MAFGIKREELNLWKQRVAAGEVAFLTHYWQHPRFPEMKTVTKAGCADIERLIAWGMKYDLKKEWIHQRLGYPHFDLLGERQQVILESEGLLDHLKRFRIL
ncbi:hypothetical protein [Ammoniphilus sp. CFH 90114]|uniref:hypothetical protein n=1 Tax=Ammoniphilus sp. CFH 90114 TaxID=2493665 RepID=UPI00100F2E68|nr:hypothetical protein [Ammoniphilus sp. CFH 90114]RXT07809.1 hypothetical protein EIZ39_10280 [Ammoniphilus sp. CFH 90114]